MLSARKGNRMSALAGQVAAQVPKPVGLRIVVTVGTDHHPFDRLIAWTNDWLAQHPDRVHRVFVQAGPASVVPACPYTRFLETVKLDALLDEADVVVCHGGPGSIADAWARGHIPIAVPRLRRFGEVVDDHQVDFCRKLAEFGRIRMAEESAGLAGLLDDADRNNDLFRVTDFTLNLDAAVMRFGELVEELMGRPPRWRPLRHMGQHMRGPSRSRTGNPAIASNQSSRSGLTACTDSRASGSSARADPGEKANEEQE